MTRTDETFPFGVGNRWDDIRAALSLSGEPEPYVPEGRPQNGSQYRIESQGVWLFLTASSVVRSIRFDAPFRGAVDGVRIGDSSNSVRKKKGPPDRKWPVADGINRWLYDLHPGFIRFDFDAKTDTVVTIFL